MFTLTDLRVNHRHQPLGLDVAPSFSWKLMGDKNGLKQAAYRVVVLQSTEQVWDSGRVDSCESVAVSYNGPTLLPLTNYDVVVYAWNTEGEKAQAATSFETGILNNRDFSGKWITHDLPKEETACPVFFKRFSSEKPVRARLLSSACGVYEAELNGKTVSDDLLRPGWTNYRKRIQYQTYDVTALLQEENELRMTVAPGWYAGYLNGEGQNHHYDDTVAAFAELHLWYADGSHQVIKTDEDWQITTGPIRFAEIYHGQTIDRQADSAAPRSAIIYDKMDNSRLIAQEDAAVRVIRKLEPVALIHTPKGEAVIDFGQNIAGVVELTVDGKPGQKIVLRHAEVLDRDGNFYTTNLRTARATDTFVCSGGLEIFRPNFTFHGFRYICVEGMGEEPELSSFKACAVHSAMQEIGSFNCSNEKVNRLWENIHWSMRDNFVDIPTDCPQRDERLGWTGDASVFCETAGQLEDTYLFFKKWLADLASEQSAVHGIPDTIPNILMPPDTPCGGSAVWGDSAAIVPWTVYWLSGDKSILTDQYQSMKDWVEWIRRTETADHLHMSGHQRGDWLALDREEGIGNQGYTDPHFLATAFYAYSTWILAESAKILGKTADAEEYSALYKAIREGFQKEFITRSGRLVSETQTACALVLCFRLAEPAQEEKIVQVLADNLARHHGNLTTGFIGTPYLCKALTQFGRHDLAGKLLLNEKYPSWLNEVNLGATTIWERWDSMHADGSFDESGMNSFNHYSFGAVGSWMLQELAGICALEAGYRKLRIEPKFVQGITEADASIDTPYGKAACKWVCRSGKITVDVEIPANTEAEIILPEQNEIICTGSGSYHYEYDTDTRLEPQRYTMDTTIRELMQNAMFVTRMEQISPGASQGLRMEFMQQKTLGEVLTMMPAGAAAPFQGILDAMNTEE